MERFQRVQVATLCQWLVELPEQIIAIFGLRQTGKTTIVCQALSRIDLESRYLGGR